MSTKVKADMDYTALGKLDGHAIQDELVKTQSAMRKVLVQRAGQFSANSETIGKWLDGFGEVMGKTKKSEASTVFKAYAVSSDKVKTAVLTANQGAGDYNSFITECRKIRDGGETVEPGSRAGNKRVTAKGQAAIVEHIAVMSGGQAKEIITHAVNKLKAANPETWERAVMIEIDNLADLLEESKQPFFQEIAEKVHQVGHKFLTDASAGDAKAAAIKQKAAETTDASKLSNSELKMDGDNVTPMSPSVQQQVEQIAA